MTDMHYPHALPEGYRVDNGQLWGPSELGPLAHLLPIASHHIGDGLWFDSSRSNGIDTHPLRRCPDMPSGYHPFGTFACLSDVEQCARKGFGIRRGAFISSLPLDFGTAEAVSSKCWTLVKEGQMAPYDEAAIRELAASYLRANIDRLTSQLEIGRASCRERV